MSAFKCALQDSKTSTVTTQRRARHVRLDSIQQAASVLQVYAAIARSDIPISTWTEPLPVQRVRPDLSRPLKVRLVHALRVLRVRLPQHLVVTACRRANNVTWVSTHHPDLRDVPSARRDAPTRTRTPRQSARSARAVHMPGVARRSARCALPAKWTVTRMPPHRARLVLLDSIGRRRAD